MQRAELLAIGVEADDAASGVEVGHRRAQLTLRDLDRVEHAIEAEDAIDAADVALMRGDLQGMMFLGLALTEAITFYALLMSFVAFFIA